MKGFRLNHHHHHQAAEGENALSHESIEVNADSVLPLHAQDALRIYGENNGSSNGGMHRTSSSTSVTGAGAAYDTNNCNGSVTFCFPDVCGSKSTGSVEKVQSDHEDHDEISQSHHSLPSPEAATGELEVNTKPVAVAATIPHGEDGDDEHAAFVTQKRSRNRYLMLGGGLLLVVAAILIGVLVGTKGGDGDGDIEGNAIVLDPDNPNDFPPTSAPVAPGDDDEASQDDFPFLPGDQDGDPVTSAPVDLTDYCPLNLEMNGITITDFNQSIVLYGETENDTAIGVNNNENTAKSKKHALPACQDNVEYGRGLWYTVMGPGAVVRATTCQGMGLVWEDSSTANLEAEPLDTQLSVFTSQTSLCTDGLVCVTANDDAACGTQSTVSWYGEEGRLYYIFVSGKPKNPPDEDTAAVDERQDDTEHFPVGTFVLTLELAPIGTCDAAIDYKAEATAVSVQLMDPFEQKQVTEASSLLVDTLLGAMIGLDPCVPGEWLGRGGEIWYKVEGKGNWIMASTCQGTSANEFPPRLALYKGDCDQLECALAKASTVAPSVDRDCGFGFSFNWWAQLGEEYYIMVYKTNFLPGVQFGLTVEEFSPPPNDNCTGATLLETDGTVTYGSTLRATYTSDQLAPTCSSEDISQSHPGVWYKVVGTGSRLTASLCNDVTKFDTKISVYSGTCGNLECVTANDEWCGYQSSVDWESTYLTTYYILVHGSTGGTAASMGDFGLAVFEFKPTVNDFCTDAIQVKPGSVTKGSTTTASKDDYEESCDYTGVNSKNSAPGVWYKVIGTGGGMRASTCGSETDFDTRIAIYRGEDCQQLKCVMSDDNGCGFQSSAYWHSKESESYYILVTGNLFSSFGDFVLHIDQYKPNTINDFCVDAISASTTTVNLGSTKNATFDGVVTCVVPNTAPGIWYKVDGTGAGMVASTCHVVTDFDTRISVFRGSDCEALECVAGNDDSHQSSSCVPSSSSQVSWLSQLGQEYHILVHGWGALVGTFGLNIEEVVPLVENDFCITSIDVQVSVGNTSTTSTAAQPVILGSNVDATVDNVPVCGDVESIGHGVWYRSIGTGNRLMASTCNQGVSGSDGTTGNAASATSSPEMVTDFDTQISVFRGGCRTLECVGANNDRCGSQSAVNFLMDEGEVFYVLVHGEGESTGSFGLVLEETSPQVPNDFCDTASALDVPVSGGSNQLLGTSVDASYDTVEECIVPNTSPGVWYKVKGTGGPITLTTCGAQTNFDTRLSVYTGSCQSLECVTGNDDTSRDNASCGLTSTVTWLSVQGQTYIIRVHGWGSLVGTFLLTISEEQTT